MDFIRVRVVFSVFIVASFLTVTSRAQQSDPDAKSGSSTSNRTENRVVLKVGDQQVTEEEFESRIGDLESGGGGDPDKGGVSEKERRQIGDDYAAVLMLSQLAVSEHLDQSPEIRHKLEVARLQVLSDAKFNNLMNQAKPTFEEVNNYYSAHLSDYDEVHIRRLFIWKQHDSQKNTPVLSSQAARARADQIRQAYASGADVRKLSEDLRKSGDGLLDPDLLAFPRGELAPQMEKVAFSLKEGEWSEVEDTSAHLLLIQLVKLDRKQLGQVSSSIEKDLQGQKMEALLDELKKKAGIWMDEQYFGTVVAPVPGAQRRKSDPPSELQKSAKGESNHEER